MKPLAWLCPLALIHSASVIAAPGPRYGGAEIQLRVAGERIEVRLLGELATLTIPRNLASYYVTRSHAVASGRDIPDCEQIQDDRAEAITTYTACYSATEVELLIFGGYEGLSLSTAELEALLRAAGSLSAARRQVPIR